MRWAVLSVLWVACGRVPSPAASSSSGEGPAAAVTPPPAIPGAPSEAVVALPPDAPWILAAEETVAVVAIRGDQVQATVRSAAAEADIEARINRVLAAAGCTATLPETAGVDRRWHCADPERGYRGLDITLGAAASDGARPVSLLWFRRPSR